MKINFQIFILYLIFFVLIAENLYAQRMQPPPVLIEIIEEFSKMESKFENKKWHEASDTLAAIKEKIEQLKMADASQLDFNKVIDRLKLAFEKKDIKTTENNYIQLQQMLFLYSDNFDYKIPPIISIMNKYINDEAAEALEKNDYDEVYSEMREVGSLFRNSRALLANKQIPEETLKKFYTTLIEVIKNCKKDDKSSVKPSFEALQTIFKSFLSAYN